MQNGSAFHLTGAVDFDASLPPRLGPGTSFAYFTGGNFEGFEEAWLRAAEESEYGEVNFIIAPITMNMQGLATRVVATSRIPKVEDSNVQMPAEDVTSTSDEEARNAPAENKQKQSEDCW
ncbi:unnamed protein product [Clonostachys solani]|uniref:Uncharacterized protein n=1 Tax=Clonostachys solani TaxID=160281 RepID=A0A9N9YRW9_9HYPO|nr:unnamed protein product [Clonostachys solani]